jgi:hypothetical protein
VVNAEPIYPTLESAGAFGRDAQRAQDDSENFAALSIRDCDAWVTGGVRANLSAEVTKRQTQHGSENGLRRDRVTTDFPRGRTMNMRGKTNLGGVENVKLVGGAGPQLQLVTSGRKSGYARGRWVRHGKCVAKMKGSWAREAHQ